MGNTKKLILRSLLVIASLAVLTVGGGIGYVMTAFPRTIPVPDLAVDRADTALLQRGEYLVHHVVNCLDCHSARDTSKWSLPAVKGTEGAGGLFANEEFGFPGQLWAPNLTPFNLGSWSDGELARAIACGINKEGNALFPAMPYGIYKNLTEGDLKAVIAYLRTLEPIENDLPKSEVKFPLNLIMRFEPDHAQPTDPSILQTGLDSGKYLVAVGGCQFCHTPIDDQHKPLPGLDFAGGHDFGGVRKGEHIYSANITPSKEYGIGNWSEEAFVARFKAYQNIVPHTVKPGHPNTIMPWGALAHMHEQDLRNIYRYLQTVKPIDKKAEVFAVDPVAKK